MGATPSTHQLSADEAKKEHSILIIQCLLRVRKAKLKVKRIRESLEKERLKQIAKVEAEAKEKERKRLLDERIKAENTKKAMAQARAAREEKLRVKLLSADNIDNVERARERLKIAVLCQRVIRNRISNNFADVVLRAMKSRKKTEYDGDNFLLAVQDGDIEACKQFLPLDKNDINYNKKMFEEEGEEEGTASINWVDRDGFTALHFAILKPDYEMLSFILDYNGKIVNINQKNRFGRTPLGLAYDLLEECQTPQAWPNYKSKQAKMKKLLFEKCIEKLELKNASISFEEANLSLLKASQDGNVEKCKELIENSGADPNLFDLTSTLINTYYRDIPRCDGLPTNDVMKSLLPKNHTLHSLKGVGNHSPLHRAAYFGQDKVAGFLLGVVKDPNMTNQELMYETPLHVACARGHSQVVAVLLADPRTNPNSRDLNDDTPLHFAAKNGHFGVIRELMFMPAMPSSNSNLIRRTLCICTPVGYGAATPLGIIREMITSSLQLPCELSDGAPSWKQRQEAIEAATFAAKKFEKCRDLLVQAGASVSLEEADINLLTAAEEGDVDKCRIAVEVEGARIDCTRPMVAASAHFKALHGNGRTPLHSAAAGGEQRHVNVIDYLLYKGASKELLDKNGETPRQIAERLDYHQAARRFRDPYQRANSIDSHDDILFGRSGAAAFGFEGLQLRPTHKLTTEEAQERSTMIQQANILLTAKLGDFERANRLLEDSMPAVSEKDIEEGDDDDGDMSSIEDEQPHMFGLPSSLNLPEEKKFSILVNAVSPNFGETPLHLASYKGHSELMTLLISYGADVNATDKTGWTPMHYVALVGCIEALEILLDSGADPLLLSGDGETPLEVAQKTDQSKFFLSLFNKSRSSHSDSRGLSR